MTRASSGDGAVVDIHRVVEGVYRSESRRVLATLIRLLGDFDIAEEALHDAFIAAVEQWERDGVPQNPRAWLVSTGRFKAIDRIRRRSRFDVSLEDVIEHIEAIPAPDTAGEHGAVEDDRLRLIFTCCHPALAPDAQVALTLREVCGLTTEEIARAHLTSPATVAQRIVRAKAKIRDARVPYEIPGRGELAERLDGVLRVIYLVFNEGYLASSGEALVRQSLTTESIRLGRLLVELLPEPEAVGLLALMLLHESRHAARASPSGEIVLLAEQDRSMWNRAQIGEAVTLVEAALASRRFGVYSLQAAIAALHAEAPSADATDWAQIVGLYDALLRADPSPVVELNRAVAVAMRDGPAAGLTAVDAILDRGELADYHLAHSARADLCRRLGDLVEARKSYRRALDLTRQASERRFLERRLVELEK
ncbi:MAG TPA: RNA polymerase sigma factor [Burkholderiaceae bacterium]|jgi:RNA polymerase sigma-70 factor (ECF subfamily)